MRQFKNSYAPQEEKILSPPGCPLLQSGGHGARNIHVERRQGSATADQGEDEEEGGGEGE